MKTPGAHFLRLFFFPMAGTGDRTPRPMGGGAPSGGGGGADFEQGLTSLDRIENFRFKSRAVEEISQEFVSSTLTTSASCNGIIELRLLHFHNLWV